MNRQWVRWRPHLRRLRQLQSDDRASGATAVVHSATPIGSRLPAGPSTAGDGGQPVWQTDELAWNSYFVDPSRTHLARLHPEDYRRGSYTMILGPSAYLALPATTPRTMHGGASWRLRRVEFSNEN